jgi:hypothetical protein
MSEHALRRPIALLGLTHLAIGCWMMFATESFGDTVASFDGFTRTTYAISPPFTSPSGSCV